MSGRRSVRDARFSIVVPLYNEAEGLPELRRRLTAVLEDMTSRFEVILVDDGSSDATPALIDEIAEEDPRFRCLHLSRNFGHQAAVTAGLHHASGDVTCVMDGDLQDPPEVLPELAAEWEKGFEVVYAVRRERKEHWAKVALYDAFYRILARLSSVPMPLDAGDFSLMSREVVEAIGDLPEKERFVRGLRTWVGYRQTGVLYERSARSRGRSKYSLLGLLGLAVNGIVSFSERPLVYVTVLGLLTSVAALVYAAYLVFLAVFLGQLITGYASLMGGMLFLGGVQLTALGILGIYVSKVFREVKGRPTYIVRASKGFETPREGDGA